MPNPRRHIPYGRQDISDSDVEAVVQALKSDWITQGPAVPAFESVVAAHCGVRHAVAVNSATSALHIACLALGLGPGDRLWTSPISFVASANCGLYCGAQVDFVDIDSQTFNICPQALRSRLERASLQGTLPKVLVAVDMCGQSCDMRALRQLADEFHFSIIEDASHAIGGSYRGEPVGSCRYSDITVLSFHPVKIITTAEGGMALTNDPVLSRRMELLRSHGITRIAGEMESPAEGDWYYQQVTLGFNYRLTDLQAALGSSQMRRLDAFVDRRNALAERYDRALAGTRASSPVRKPECRSAFHLYVVRLPHSPGGSFRAEVFKRLRGAGIGVNVHYIPIHLQPHYRRLGFETGMFPVAEHYYECALTLPLYSSLTEDEQDYVVEKLLDALH